jgi:hypothetical protein
LPRSVAALQKPVLVTPEGDFEATPPILGYDVSADRVTVLS